MKLPAFTILIDTREQAPLVFPGYETNVCSLKTGDYSAYVREKSLDLIGVVAIERKSVSDLLGCVGQSRERFERELERLAEIRWRGIVVEGDLEAIAAGTRHSTLTPKQIVGTLTAWSTRYGIPVWPCPDRFWAAAVVRTILTHAVRWALEEKP